MNKIGGFPIGAWVRASDMPWYTGLAHDGRGGIRYVPSLGEIIKECQLGPGQGYQVKFGECKGFISRDGAVCFHCEAPDDESHGPQCPALWLRGLPHTPGFGPEEQST